MFNVIHKLILVELNYPDTGTCESKLEPHVLNYNIEIGIL